jgi:hypothetical protein
MPKISLDDDDPMLVRQQAPELVGDDLSADATTEDYDGLCVCHDVPLPLR